MLRACLAVVGTDSSTNTSTRTSTRTNELNSSMNGLNGLNGGSKVSQTTSANQGALKCVSLLLECMKQRMASGQLNREKVQKNEKRTLLWAQTQQKNKVQVSTSLMLYTVGVLYIEKWCIG